MNKKIIYFILVLIVLINAYPMVIVANATSNDNITDNVNITYLEDGSYFISTLSSDPTISRTTSTKSGTRTVDYYSSSNIKLITFILNASFSYTGYSATCTSASTSYIVHESAWKVTSSSATKSVNTATADFTAKKYLLGIPVNTQYFTFSISCSNTGVLS